MQSVRNLVIVLGDQLDRRLLALDDFDANRDIIWMAENQTEATHVWCHKKRLALFFAAMRHHRDDLREHGHEVWYHTLEADARHDSGADFSAILTTTVNALSPTRLVMTGCAKAHGLTRQIRPDRHFCCGLDAFEEWADPRNLLVLEHFYRWIHRAENVLMDGEQPKAGQWNFDKDNRETFGRNGPGELPHVRRFRPDHITREVIDMVESRFPGHPGRIDGFDLPVTHKQARIALGDFIAKRLPAFGTYQDALWTEVHFAYHSRLSAALNQHLIDPLRFQVLNPEKKRRDKTFMAELRAQAERLKRQIARQERL